MKRITKNIPRQSRAAFAYKTLQLRPQQHKFLALKVHLRKTQHRHSYRAQGRQNGSDYCTHQT